MIFKESTKLRYLACLTFKTCFPLGVLLGFAAPSLAQQQLVYGRGPALASPVLPATEGFYSLETGIDCPTPTFNVGGFGAGGNDWANNDVPYASSNTGINNYGVAAGIRIPFGGDLRRFCSDFAKAKVSFERTRVESQLRDAQVTLLRQCMWLKDVGIDLHQQAFQDPDFLALLPCKKLNLVRSSSTLPYLPPSPKPGTDDNKPAPPSSGTRFFSEIPPPPASDTRPFSTPTPVIQRER